MRKKKVLIIEDQEATLMVMAQRVGFAGFEALTASNGRDGIELARKEPVRLILLDLMMPEMNGFEVIRELKKYPETKSIPVVVVTAFHTGKDEEASVLTGARHTLTKPVPPHTLRLILKKYLGSSTESDR